MLYIQREQISDAQRLVKTTGNVGRKVTRLLGRIFNVGRFYAVFDVKAADILDAALFQSRVRDAVFQASKLPAASNFSVRVESRSDHNFVGVVITPLAIPEGLRERKLLLQAFLEVIMPIKGAVEVARDRRELDAMRRQYRNGCPPDIAERDIRDLAALVRGNYSNFDNVGMHTQELAAVLNPEIYGLMDKQCAASVLAA